MQLVIKCFIFLVCFFAVERFCRWQTGGFRLHKATTAQIYPFQATCQRGPKELYQNFSFLASGVQSYVFLGEDGQTVLKLFKHYHGECSNQSLSLLCPKFLRESILKKREKRMVHLLKSVAISHQKLFDYTQVFYTHLGKTTSLLGKIQIKDKLGILYTLDLDQTEFFLQRYMTPVKLHLKKLLASGKVDDALTSMRTLLDTIESRSRQGVKNKDGNPLENCGFLSTKAYELDVGSYSYRSTSTHLNPHKKAREKTKSSLLKWVKKYYPKYFAHCQSNL